MMLPHVTRHAIARYRERIANGTDDEIVATLSTDVFKIASAMGRCAVILSCGARAIVEDGVVVTVLPRGRRVMNWAGKANLRADK